MFLLIDSDHDGFITEDEIAKMMKSLGEKVGTFSYLHFLCDKKV